MQWVITLDASPANGRPNHIQLPPNSRQLIVRDTFAEWDEVPSELSIEKISGPEASPSNLEADAQHCADLITAGAPYWDAFMQRFHSPIPANTLIPVRETPAGVTGQSSTVGRFDLEPGQALAITIHDFGANYMGFQTGSDWYQSIDYANHTSSLTNKQAKPNPDGSITYLVSQTDPGVANWIDVGAHNTGVLQFRWHELPQPVPVGYTPAVQVVNVADLPGTLPAGTPLATPSAHAAQIAERQTQVRTRFEGFAPELLSFDLNTFGPRQ